MLASQNHYYGKSKGEHRKQVAKDDLNTIFYRNKTIFSFEKDVTKMRQTFNVIENYNGLLYKEKKSSQRLDNINFPNNVLKTEVNICRYSHSAILDTTSTYLSTFISRLFPAAHPSSVRYGRRQQAN